MASQWLSCHELCNIQGKELAECLQKASTNASESSVNAFLLEAVESGGVPPTVYRTWLSIAREDSSLTSALNSDSRHTRKYAVKRLGSLLRSEKWQPTWDLVGGVQGWLRLFERSCVDDIQQLVHALRRSQRHEDVPEEKKISITSLVQALFPDHFPDSPYKTKDTRQLSSLYIRLLPLCNSDFVMNFLDTAMDNASKITYDPGDGLMLHNHYPAIRAAVMEDIKQKDSPRKWMSRFWYQPLMQSVPPIPSKRFPRWSASMEYAYDLLTDISLSLHITWTPDEVLQSIASPLLSRSLERRAGTESHLKICDAALNFAEKHSRVKRSYGLERLLGLITHLWSRHPGKYEEVLMRAFRVSRVWSRTLADCTQYLSSVREGLRYNYFRLHATHACPNPVDVESDPRPERLQKVNWSVELFERLEPEPAADFLRRLLNNTENGLRMQRRYRKTVIDYPLVGTTDVDLSLLLVLLQDGSLKAISEAEEKIDEHSKLATKTRDSAERMKHATLALLYSIGSSDLETLRKTVDFLKRFTRDHEAPRTVFSRELLSLGEHIELLAGTKKLNKGVGAEQIAQAVQSGNEILMMYLDILFQAVKEPSFSSFQWTQIRSLFTDVLQARLKNASKLQEKLSLADERMYKILWGPTIQTFVEAESKWIQPAYDKLGFRDALVFKPRSVPGSLSEMSFLDEFSKARDEIWMKYRMQIKPSVTTLPPIWPRGLPIQAMVPILWDGVGYVNLKMPYLESRVKSLLFANSEDALNPPLDDEVTNLVEDYIDDYATCLQVYVLGGSKEEQSIRRKKAWNHATAALSPFKSISRSHTYWRMLFDSAIGSDDIVTKELAIHDDFRPQRLSDLAIPSHFDFDNVNEWDPDETRPFPLPTKNAIYADFETQIDPCFESGSAGQQGKFTRKIDHLPSTAEYFKAGMDPGLVRGSARLIEGVIVAAVLYLDVKKGGSSISMHREAFPPNIASKRFPPILLDAEFTANGSRTVDDALQVLRLYLIRVPPDLVFRLAKEALSVAKTTEPPQRAVELVDVIFGCLGILVKSDRPQLARDLIFEVIMCLPDVSSWYRQVFKKGFIRSLPPEQAIEFVGNFIDHLVQVSESRRIALKDITRRKGNVERGGEEMSLLEEEERKIPFVKVTTVKMVAQLLCSSDVFGLEASIKLLQRLLDNFSQPDIRCAALDSMISLIGSGSEASLKENFIEEVCKLLKSMRVVIGGLNERYATDERMWAAVNLKEALPDIGTEFPIFNNLLTAAENKELPEKIRECIQKDVLVPAIYSSVESNKRWLALFTKKHSISVHIETLPIAPIIPEMLEKCMVSFKEWIPKDILDIWQKNRLFQLAPPDDIIQASRRVVTDFKLKESPEGNYWLLVMPTADKIGEYDISPISFVAKMLASEHDFNKASIKITDLINCILEQAKKILDLDLPHAKMTRMWEMYHVFCDKRESVSCAYGNKSRITILLWKERYEPIAEQMLQLVESYMTPERRQNPRAHPRRLPDTFPLRIYLIPYAHGGLQGPARVKANEETFDGILALLRRLLVERPATFHHRLPRLKQAFPIPAEDQVYIIRRLADVDPRDLEGKDGKTIEAMCRIDVASTAVRSLPRPPSKSFEDEVRQLVEDWKNSSVEEVRQWAWEIYDNNHWIARNSEALGVVRPLLDTRAYST